MPKIRGQGTFEYVLLLGGVLLIVVLALMVLNGTFVQSSTGISDVQLKKCKAAAQTTPACFNGAAFDGTNRFHMLGYPDLLYCNCSNFNPGEFSASVGQAPWPSLDFYTPASQTPYSPLYFDAAPTPPVGTYAFTITLPAGTYHFYLETGNSLTQLEPDTTATVSNGRQAYSWTNLPTASKIQIIPTKTLTQDQRDTALQQKEQTPSADEQEKTATQKIEKAVDADNNLKLLHAADGKNRAIYEDTPKQDYAGPLTLTVPSASDKIEKTYPATTQMTQNADNPAATDLYWDRVQLKAGTAFKFIIQYKSDQNDLQTLSDETDANLQKLAGKNPVKTKPNCPSLFGLTLPFGCTGASGSESSTNPSATPNPTTQCPTLPLTTIQIPFGCIGPTPTPSLTPPSENPSASPNPKCVAADQGCGLLPGSTACCTGYSCQLQISIPPTAQCKPDGHTATNPTATPTDTATISPTPTGTPSPSPTVSATPTPNPSDQPDLSVPMDDPYILQVGDGNPYAALLVGNVSAPSTDEAAFLKDMQTDYPRVDLINYANATGDLLSGYPAIYVIAYNKDLDADALATAYQNGAEINALGTASQYAPPQTTPSGG